MSQLPFPEEPWEDEIAGLLGGLAMVDPPAGFIDRAIDHRPLFAGRMVAGLALAAVVVFGGTVALGAFGQPRLVPDLGTLTSGSAVIQSGGSASVFRQAGRLELDELPGGTRMDLAGRDAWVDHDEKVVVVADDGTVVTMVGVTPEQAEMLIDDIDGAPVGFAGVVNRLTADLGFPDLS